ncbi:hypothetical protein [Terrimonas ferruginea]|uniref:hypothetical protein n=1 Tax=Terrimonas ferruginea TaxID=249 RepID=UPI00041D74F9|nr:hypothetical protein [Terrimonas ferruginea]
MKKILTVFAVAIFAFSCRKNDKPDPQPVYAFKGLFEMTTSFSSDPENFLFENGRVFYGNEAGNIHATIASGSNLNINSTTYTYDAGTQKIKFDYSGRKWEGTYVPATGKIINGVVKSFNGLATVGAFNGQKHIPGTSGSNLLKGHWKGVYGPGNNLYNLIIEDNSMIVVAGYENSLMCNNNTGIGLSLSRPAINDKTITCIYQYIGLGTFSMEATYNPSSGKLEGTWGTGTNVSGGGTIVLTPENID